MEQNLENLLQGRVIKEFKQTPNQITFQLTCGYEISVVSIIQDHVGVLVLAAPDHMSQFDTAWKRLKRAIKWRWF